MSSGPIERWDLFISHASEDKNDFVQPLASALDAFGVGVWYDAFTLKLGDSLSRSIDRGLAKSDYGLVVLSPAFLSKQWPEYELRGLTAKELSGRKVILPIWHNVSREDILQFSPTLSDKVAIKSDGLTPLQIAVQVIEIVRPEIFEKIHRRIAHYVSLTTIQNIPAKDIHSGPIRHEELPADLIGRIRLVRASLLGAYTHSMDFWLDGFKRDAHPSNEVAYWERVAAVYREYVSMAPASLTREQHEKIYKMILLLNIDEKLAGKEAAGLPEGAFEQISELYAHSLPVYDLDEKAFSCGRDEDITDKDLERLKDTDKELFPNDLPEELIRELIRNSPD
jgi:hypothetical protein